MQEEYLSLPQIVRYLRLTTCILLVNSQHLCSESCLGRQSSRLTHHSLSSMSSHYVVGQLQDHALGAWLLRPCCFIKHSISLVASCAEMPRVSHSETNVYIRWHVESKYEYIRVSFIFSEGRTRIKQ